MSEISSMMETASKPELLYLDLLKRVLTRTGFTSYQLWTTRGWRRKIYGPIIVFLEARGFQLVRRVEPEVRRVGGDWPSDAETMVGMDRLDNLQTCVSDVITNEIPGDFIETGVWRGGASIFMAGALRAFGDTERTVWVADSFRGLPAPKQGAHVADVSTPLCDFDALAVPLEKVQENFRRYGLLSDQIKFLPGWFEETLPGAPIDRLAILRLDGDMYDSTMVALENLYSKLSVGGYVIVDDYGALDSCRKAVEDFRMSREIEDPIVKVDWTAVYWKKTQGVE